MRLQIIVNKKNIALKPAINQNICTNRFLDEAMLKHT